MQDLMQSHNFLELKLSLAEAVQAACVSCQRV